MSEVGKTLKIQQSRVQQESLKPMEESITPRDLNNEYNMNF
jgi:hypothetical protein